MYPFPFQIFLTTIVCFLSDHEEFCLGSYQRLALGGACGLGLLVHLLVCTSNNCSPFLCSGFGFVGSSLILVTALLLFMSVALSSSEHVWTSLLVAKKHFDEVIYFQPSYLCKSFNFLNFRSGVK